MGEIKHNPSKTENHPGTKAVELQTPDFAVLARAIERARIRQKIVSNASLSNSLATDLRGCELDVQTRSAQGMSEAKRPYEKMSRQLAQSLQRCRADAELKAVQEAKRQLKKEQNSAFTGDRKEK